MTGSEHTATPRWIQLRQEASETYQRSQRLHEVADAARCPFVARGVGVFDQCHGDAGHDGPHLLDEITWVQDVPAMQTTTRSEP
jgi:hypothetical protein